MNKKSKDKNVWDKKRLVIETITAIAICFIGIQFGASQNTIVYNGDVITYEVYSEVIKSIDEANEEIGQKTQGQEIVEYALRFIGEPYVYGGVGLTNGADSSGFVKTLYKHFGFVVPRSIDGIKSIGTEVTLAEAEPGDIVCYETEVGVYIGDGEMISSSKRANMVAISTVNDAATVTVRRITN